MKKSDDRPYLAVFAIIILALVGAIYIVFERNKPYLPPVYVYGNPKESIENIELEVLYAVPKNKFAIEYAPFKAELEKVLGEAAEFHHKQFRGLSKFSYKIADAPVILNKDNLTYDTYDTTYGNFTGLQRITLELETRLGTETRNISKNKYKILGIIYEGVGASGTEGSLILSRDFITMNEYKDVSSSLLYHEFGHAIGMPEGYDIQTGEPFTDDVMGSGRLEPLSRTYIQASTLKEMGVTK